MHPGSQVCRRRCRCCYGQGSGVDVVVATLAIPGAAAAATTGCAKHDGGGHGAGGEKHNPYGRGQTLPPWWQVGAGLPQGQSAGYRRKDGGWVAPIGGWGRRCRRRRARKGTNTAAVTAGGPAYPPLLPTPSTAGRHRGGRERRWPRRQRGKSQSGRPCRPGTGGSVGGCWGGKGGEGGGVCRPRETGGSNVAQMSPIGSNEPVSTVHTKFRQRWRFAADTCDAARNGLPFRFNEGPAWTAPPVRRCTAVLALPVAHTVLHSYAHPPHSPCQAPRAQPAVLVGSCAAPGRVREREPATSQLSLVWLPTTANRLTAARCTLRRSLLCTIAGRPSWRERCVSASTYDWHLLRAGGGGDTGRVVGRELYPSAPYG